MAMAMVLCQWILILSNPILVHRALSFSHLMSCQPSAHVLSNYHVATVIFLACNVVYQHPRLVSKTLIVVSLDVIQMSVRYICISPIAQCPFLCMHVVTLVSPPSKHEVMGLTALLLWRNSPTQSMARLVLSLRVNNFTLRQLLSRRIVITIVMAKLSVMVNSLAQ